MRVNQKLASTQLIKRLTRSSYRQIDEPATSIVLNIAEGNGRFSHLDHKRFLDIANRANTKLAVRIEFCNIRGKLEEIDKEEIKNLLIQIDKITASLAMKWKETVY